MKYILSVVALLFVLNISHAQKKVNWVSWDEAITAATDNPKKIYIDIYTDWCGYCKKMDRETFKDPKVIEYLNENFYPVKFDAEQKEVINFNGTEFKHRAGGRGGVHELAAALLNNQMGYPAFVILDEEFARILISPGYKGPDDVMMEMEFAHEEKYKVKSWNAFKAEHVAAQRAAMAKATQANAPTKPATTARTNTATKPATPAKPTATTRTNASAKPATPAKPKTSANTSSKTTKAKASNTVDEIFKVVEKMPRFPGCDDNGNKQQLGECSQNKMNQFIAENLVYPELASSNGVEGMTVLQFVVDKTGEINDIKIIRDIGAGCGEAAKAVVEKMPTWIPGTQRGRKVKVLYTLPVRFKLDKEKTKLTKKELKEQKKAEKKKLKLSKKAKAPTAKM